MKQFLTTGLFAAFLITGLLFTGCSGEDGEPGPAGETGAPGPVGEKGEDGAGLEHSTEYGNIVVTFKGIRSDDVPFSYTADYKYVQPGNEGAYSSNWTDITDENGTNRVFTLFRYTNPIGTELTRLYITEANGVPSFNFQEMVAFVLSDDKTLFTLTPSQDDLGKSTPSDYAFNPATGELKATYTTTIDAVRTRTHHDVEVSVTIDVTVAHLLWQ
jgi:hypothetical protein